MCPKKREKKVRMALNFVTWCVIFNIKSNTGGFIMPTATFSVRMDEKLKIELDDLCAQFGMNTSTAINLFARAVVRERRIPFEISAAPSDTGLQAFRSLRRQAKANGLQDMSLAEINEIIAQTRNRKSK